MCVCVSACVCVCVCVFLCVYTWASQVGLLVKNPLANAGDFRATGLIPGLGRSPGAGNGNPLQDSHLEDPMDGGAWKATIHGVAKSRTQLSDFTFPSRQNSTRETRRYRFPSVTISADF